MTDTNGKHADISTDTTSNTNTDTNTDTPEVAELQADIERTREELAETVDLLAAKLDVKTRVRDQVTHTVNTTKETATHQFRSVRAKVTGPDGKPTPGAMSAAGGVVAAIAAVVTVRLWLGSKSHQRSRRRRAWRKSRGH